jgi:hypothetical protein
MYKDEESLPEEPSTGYAVFYDSNDGVLAIVECVSPKAPEVITPPDQGETPAEDVKEDISRKFIVKAASAISNGAKLERITAGPTYNSEMESIGNANAEVWLLTLPDYDSAVEIMLNGKKSKFYQMESTDLVNWTEPRVILEDPAWAGYNTTVCKADGRYILSFELGKPKELVGRAFTMFFAESRDLKNWKLIEGASMGKDRYTGAPMLRYFDGWFYYFHLEGSYRHGFDTRVARSRDLKNWEFSPHVVLGYDQDDKKIHPVPTAEFTESELALIAGSKDINASDLDMCEWNGKLVCFYSWGNQRGCEFSALAEADCTEKEFCESFF